MRFGKWSLTLSYTNSIFRDNFYFFSLLWICSKVFSILIKFSLWFVKTISISLAELQRPVAKEPIMDISSINFLPIFFNLSYTFSISLHADFISSYFFRTRFSISSSKLCISMLSSEEDEEDNSSNELLSAFVIDISI